MSSIPCSIPRESREQGTPRLVPWSTELERVEVGGVPYWMYRERERSVLRFLDIASRWRGRTYLVQNDERWTFESVATAAELRAAALAAEGIVKGSRVMLLGWNSIDWIVAFWSIVRAGGVVVTANAWWSDEELRDAVELAQPALVLSDNPQRIMSPWRALGFSDLAALASPAAPLPLPQHHEEALALVMFTSGTTGLPKAAAFTHRALIAGIHSQLALTRRLPHQIPDDHPVQVTLQAGPLFHIGGVQGILRAPLLGGTLVLTRGRFDPEEVLRLIESERIDRWAGVVPTMALRLASHPSVGSYDLTSVRSLTLGGTVVSEDTMERVRETFPSAQRGVKTGWGLTETGGQLTAVSGREALEHPGSVGRALPFVELQIRDANEHGVGEVLARSPMQMSGYLGDNSRALIDEKGWLHTGDLGRFDEDGWLWLEGRSKDLIIRGGENIVPARIEQVLSEHEAVADAAVIGLPDADLGEVVAAVVVVRPDSNLDVDALAAFAAARLSKFAVPTKWWVRREPLPTNEVGKVAKSTLQATWPSEEGEAPQ